MVGGGDYLAEPGQFFPCQKMGVVGGNLCLGSDNLKDSSDQIYSYFYLLQILLKRCLCAQNIS